jgi:hypothetical protein
VRRAETRARLSGIVRREGAKMRTILAFAVLFLGVNGVVDACSCIRESEDRKTALSERLERTDLVFLGRIESTEVTKISEHGFEAQYQKTQFYILQSWKGESSSRVYVRTALECCLCEYRFPTSGVFLVFAYGPNDDGVYTTSSCDDPMSLEHAKEDVTLMDQIREIKGRPSRSREERAPAER